MDSPDPPGASAGTDAVERQAEAPPSELLNLPWVDVHNHAHTLSWSDRERFGLAGCRAMVMVASGVHWTPYDPVRPRDVEYLWDQTFKRREAMAREHAFEASLAVGVQTGVHVEDAAELVANMERYCATEEVVAVGETGVTPSQHGSPWPVDDQRAVIKAQMELADRQDLPVILHTPNRSAAGEGTYRPGFGPSGYERPTDGKSDPVLDTDDPLVDAVRMDVEAAADAGLPEHRVVASHADPDNLAYLAEETDCYLSFTVGHEWMTGVSAGTVADAIHAYGPDRIMMDTDCANVIRCDPLDYKRAVLELYRLGVDVEDIRTVVLENPREVFGVGE